MYLSDASNIAIMFHIGNINVKQCSSFIELIKNTEKIGVDGKCYTVYNMLNESDFSYWCFMEK